MGTKKGLRHSRVILLLMFLCLLMTLCACNKPVIPEQSVEASSENNLASKRFPKLQQEDTAQLTERLALDRVLADLYSDFPIESEWIGRGEYAGYKLKTLEGEQYLDSDGNHGGYYLLHLYSVIIDDSNQNLSHVATANWFEVHIDNGKIVPMYDKQGNLNEEFASNGNRKAEDVDFVDNTYHNDQFRFTLTFPENWKEKYVIIPTQPQSEINASVTFYHKSSYDSSDLVEKMGRLFSVAVYTPQKWDDERSTITSMTENLGEIHHNNLVFYFSGPTDVQFDSDNKAASLEYQTMSKDVPMIIKTMSFDKDTT